MTGIVRAASFLPCHRLSRERLAEAWRRKPNPGSKAVAHFDEDSLTMAYEAAAPLVAAAGTPEVVYFASTSAPFAQRSSAALLAAALDLPPATRTADFGASLRCGSSALSAAFDALAGGASQVLVAAGERREGAPESDEEELFGDAGAAVLVGREGIQAECLGMTSSFHDYPDEWRAAHDRFVSGSRSRALEELGAAGHSVARAKTLLDQHHVAAENLRFALLSAPHPKTLETMRRQLGVSASQLPPDYFRQTGHCGAALPLMLLARALAEARAGDLLLLTSSGEGADAWLFRALVDGPGLAPEPDPFDYPSYPIYRKLRSLPDPPPADTSPAWWAREEPGIVRLHGSRCTACGDVQFPAAQACPACGGRSLAPHKLRRSGTVFTVTEDFLAESPAPPTWMAVVDLDGGGRLLCQLTDVQRGQARPGLRVELVLRRLTGGPAHHPYYWKARPTPEGRPA